MSHPTNIGHPDRRRVRCVGLGHEGDGLDEPPMPGELGLRTCNEFSRLGWQRWLVHVQLIINERQLLSADSHCFELLLEPMRHFLFHGGAAGTRSSSFIPSSE